MTYNVQKGALHITLYTSQNRSRVLLYPTTDRECTKCAVYLCTATERPGLERTCGAREAVTVTDKQCAAWQASKHQQTVTDSETSSQATGSLATDRPETFQVQRLVMCAAGRVCSVGRGEGEWGERDFPKGRGGGAALCAESNCPSSQGRESRPKRLRSGVVRHLHPSPL